MQKVIVIGCPGSGKSTFAKALRQATALPLYHLDLLYWNTDRTTVERSLFLARLKKILTKDQWIIDGNYASTMELRMKESDTVIFLDYPLEICLQGVAERRGKARSDIPWVEQETDEEFIKFIQNFQTQNRPLILDLMKKYPEKTVYIFNDRTEADAFLKTLQK